MNTFRVTHPILFWIIAVPLGLIAAFIALTIALAVAQHPGGGVLVIVLLAAYWVPTIIAALRHHQVGMVAVLNALLAWTVIGWVVALAIACGDRRRGVVEVHHVVPPQP